MLDERARDGATRSREVTRREVVVVAIGACLLAIAMTWPLVLHIGSVVPRDIGDPLAEAWQPAWGGHALLHQPLHYFDANRFWPLKDSLAFGDALIGYAPTGIIGSGPHAAMVRYDLLFIFAYALAFFGAYMLAREIGLGPAGAVVAGAAFAFAPYRLEQDGHLQVISSGGIPLSIAFAIRGIRLRRPWWLFWAWVLAVWQVSIGWVLGLPFAYGIAGAVAIAMIAWLVRGRPPVPRGMLIACAAGAAIFIAVCYLIAHPYLYIADNFPAARRSAHEVAAFSGPLKVFLTAPEENWIWGAATAGFRNSLTTLQEKTLFPGLVIVVLAVVGLFSSSLSRRTRIGIGVAAAAMLVLELGFREEGGLLWPYRVLYEALPGWDAIRTPGRLATFSTLALALLAAAGGEAAVRAVRRTRLPAWSGAAVAALLALVIVTEGRSLPFDPFDNQAMPDVPPAQPSAEEIPTPQLHLPALTAKQNRAYQLASTDGFAEMVNGRASTNPAVVLDLVKHMANFPDAATVRELQEYGVRTVILHLGLTEGTPQAGAARKSIEGLPLNACRLPDLVVYELGSSNASSRPTTGSRAAACDFG
ncbi:MAG TPA: hypothetical protein VLB79_11325 [Solirubrobacterales bacterium]|nr:hypothetical protein [Solirubrobacterales bacterium]